MDPALATLDALKWPKDRGRKGCLIAKCLGISTRSEDAQSVHFDLAVSQDRPDDIGARFDFLTERFVRARRRHHMGRRCLHTRWLRKETGLPLIQKPKNREPLFGDDTQIIIGRGWAQQLREWQQKKRDTQSRQ
jgi:hypothetical protein